MRVTETVGLLSAQYNIQRARARVADDQQVAASGTKLNRPSDAPADAARVTRGDMTIAALEQHEKNISLSIGGLDVAESSLAGAAEALRSAKDLALQLVNGSITGAERKQSASTVRTIRDQIIGLANSRHAGVYVFGGYAEDRPPIDAAGSFNGDSNRRQIIVGENLRVEVGVTASEAFTSAGGVDVIGTLSALATALEANDVAGARSQLDALDTSHVQVTTARADTGVQRTRLIDQRSQLGDRSVHLSAERSRLADADPVEAFSQLIKAQQSLDAAVRVASRMLQDMSLVSRL